jgi:hypothetical protein
LVETADQFETFIRKGGDELTETDASFCGDGVIVAVDMGYSIEARGVD